jgi:hypothetical protein
MESIGFNGPSSNVVVGGTLINASDETIEVNAGAGGGRTISGDLINQGIIDIGSGMPSPATQHSANCAGPISSPHRRSLYRASVRRRKWTTD